jgi:uncharacterized protein Smg (DUF494 family)
LSKLYRSLEGLLDELMMNMFSLIADQVCHSQELFDKEARIMQTLLNDGYRIQDADAALTLMQKIVRQQSAAFFSADEPQLRSVRTMSSEERRSFTTEAFAFALKLAHLGVLTVDEREELLERAMHQHRERIELDQIKGMVAFMLFTSSREREEASLSGLRKLKDTDWQ